MASILIWSSLALALAALAKSSLSEAKIIPLEELTNNQPYH